MDRNKIADKLHKISEIDIYDYVKPRRNDYANIDTLDTGIHQPPFLHWSIDSGVTYEKEHYNKVISSLEQIIDCLLNGMAKECKTLFSNAGYPTIGVCDITEKDYSKRFSEYLSRCNDILYNHYDTDIAIKLAEIKLKYYRPKLYNSLFYAYCQLYDQVMQCKNMCFENEKGERYFDVLKESEQDRVCCLNLLKNCKRIKVSISKTEGKNGTPIKEISISGGTNHKSVPKACFFIAYYDLEGTDSLKWMLERDDITIKLEKGNDFEDVKKWLQFTLGGERLTNGYFEKFAKSLRGLYQYIMKCDIVNKLDFLTNTHKRDRAIELIMSLFELPDTVEMRRHLDNYIDKP